MFIDTDSLNCYCATVNMGGCSRLVSVMYAKPHYSATITSAVLLYHGRAYQSHGPTFLIYA